jgi:hypothetical protein
MQVTRDASVPVHLSAKKESLGADPEIVQLRRDCNSLRNDIIAEFHQLKKAKKASDKRYHEFTALRTQTRTRRKKLYTFVREELREGFFDGIGNQIFEHDCHGNPITFTPDTSRIQPERKSLADLEFKNRDVDTISDEELVGDLIKSLELRLELHRIQIPKPLTKHLKLNQSTTELKAALLCFLKSESGLGCPVCPSCPDLHSQAKLYVYSRKDALQAYFKTHKLLK